MSAMVPMMVLHQVGARSLLVTNDDMPHQGPDTWDEITYPFPNFNSAMVALLKFENG